MQNTQSETKDLNSLVGLGAGTKYEKAEQRPSFGAYHGFHHIEMWVCNSYQAALHYSTHMGLKPKAYSL